MPSKSTLRLRSLTTRVARSMATRAGHAARYSEIEAAFSVVKRRALHDQLATAAVLAAALRADSDVIDVGAHVGEVLADVVRLAPSGHHLAYEPVPGLHASLVRRFPQVEVRCAALSDEHGTSRFSHVTRRPAYSGLRARADLPPDAGAVAEIDVKVERLDDVLPEAMKPNLIKIDVEGAEIKVLRGARQTLAKFKPVVLFEHGIGGADLYGTTSRELWQILHECGLRIFSISGAGPYSCQEFEAMFVEPQWNYLAVPHQRAAGIPGRSIGLPC